MKGSASKRPAKTKHLKKTIDKKKPKQLKQPNRVEVTLRVSVKNMRGLVVAAISHEQPTSAAEREAIKKAVGKNGQKVIYFRSKQGSGLKNSWTNETSASTKGNLRFTTEAPIEAVQALQEALRKCPEVSKVKIASLETGAKLSTDDVAAIKQPDTADTDSESDTSDKSGTSEPDSSESGDMTGGEDGDTSAEEEEGEEEEEEEEADQLTYGKAEVLLDEKLAALKNEVFTKINQSAAAVIAEVKKIAKAEPAASGQSPATNKATTPAQKRSAAPVAATSSGARPVRARTPARKPE